MYAKRTSKTNRIVRCDSGIISNNNLSFSFLVSRIFLSSSFCFFYANCSDRLLSSNGENSQNRVIWLRRYTDVTGGMLRSFPWLSYDISPRENFSLASQVCPSQESFVKYTWNPERIIILIIRIRNPDTNNYTSRLLPMMRMRAA